MVSSTIQSGQAAERARLLAVHEVAMRFYRGQLAAKDGAGPSRFLARRGVPVDGPWVVGYAPDWPTALINELRRHGFDDVEIRASGLAGTGRSGQLVDRFRDRVMVGVRAGPDPDAAVVGFAGYAPPRAAPDVAPCVYSPGTAIFRPRELLFGLAEQPDRRGRRLIVAPDPLEAIALAARLEVERSPPLVVAPASRALGRQHVASLTQAADISAGVAVAVGAHDDARRAAERAYRRLASIVPSTKLFAADPDGRRRRPLIEALVVARVDRAADTLTSDADRWAAARAATALLATESPDVAARLRNYVRRRLGPEPDVGLNVEPDTETPPARIRQEPRQLEFHFDFPRREADRAPAPETPAVDISQDPVVERPARDGSRPDALGEVPEVEAATELEAAPDVDASPEVEAARPANVEPLAPPAAHEREAPRPPADLRPEEPASAQSSARAERPGQAEPRSEHPAPAERPAQQEPPARAPDAALHDELARSQQAAPPDARRFVPSGQQDLAPSGERARVEANLAAIRTLQALAVEQRPATPEEQELLARWSGWGATPQLFDEREGFKGRFASERAELRELLGEGGYRAARATTLNAHYTDVAYVQATWSALRELGFTGGRVLEPGCGSGNFIGLAPKGAQAVGVELDPTTAAIAQALYPDAEVRAESFADTRFSPGTFDLTVGNVPFGNHKLSDPDHNPGRQHSIHNHFILKSLRLTRPGGMVAVITSRYTMDGEDEAHVLARTQMGELGDLVGAVRLPTSAHSVAAGTEVVTDLLILRRREDGPTREGVAWKHARPTEIPGARHGIAPAAHRINEYFLDYPEQVLGRTITNTGRFGPTLAVLGVGPTAPALTQALARIVARARDAELTMTPPARASAETPARIATPTDQPDGTFLHVGNGRFVQVREGRHATHRPPRTQTAELRALIELRDTVLALLDEEAAHEQDTWRMNELRVELNTRYERYVANHGSINRYKASSSTRLDKSTGEVVETERRTYPRMGGFRDDPFFPYVSALEKFDDETQATEKADIFRRRVAVPRSPADRAASPDDALVICWDTHNEVRLDEIARLLGLSTEAEAREALGTLVYDEPGTGRLIRRAEYLSGNVRKKLADAERAAAEDRRLTINVEALRAVVPRDLTPGEIGARLGSPWIDATYVQQFLREILEDTDIMVSNIGARWSVSGGSKGSILSRAVWGTQKRCAQDLAKNLLNSQTIEITETIKTSASTTTVKNEEATAIAQAKANQLDDRFRAWLWEEPRRAEELSRFYNDRFNALVPQSYDGERVSAPGMSAAYELHPHQMAAIARTRNTAGVGLFHGTGAGKTLEMIVGGMELRRLGLVEKPAYVVPKAVVGQFQREFLQAYPRARVLAVDSEDLKGDKLRQFVARCSTGNWDAVIISHTAFKRNPVSKDIRVAYLTRQRDRLRAFLTNADGADRHTVKDIEKQVENLGERIKEELARTGEAGVEFQRTGIDYLFIDEAHTYKNLAVLSSIPELAHKGNQITRDLDMKLEYLRERYGRRVVTLATATPLDNSPSEILTMLKYAAPQILEEVGISEDDEFHAAFVQPRRRLEMKPDGSGFKSRMRYARFVNLPELKRLMYSFADVKLKEDLPLDEPAIVGGKAEILSVPDSAELRQCMVEFASRGRSVTGGKAPLRRTKNGELREDNILWISTDGRMASLDVRMVGMHTDEPQKVDVLADVLFERWLEHRDDVYYAKDGTPDPIRGSLQLAFCDLGVPAKGRWSFYEALRDALVARGMPAGQVRFAQEATDRRKKDQLQRDARDGKIAVLIGSRTGLGTGVNIQRRVTAIYQVDATWKLTPLEQSLGRGKRQGNMNAEIHHVFLVTENSYEPFLWQKVDDKSRFTRALLDRRDTSRTIDVLGEDDGGRINPAEMFAVAAGRPELLELDRVEGALTAMRLEQRIWHDDQFTYKATISQNRQKIADVEKTIARLDDVLSRRRDTRGEAFAMTLEGRVFDSRPEAGRALIERVVRDAQKATGWSSTRLPLGDLGNIPLTALVAHPPGEVASVVLEFELAGAAVAEYAHELGRHDPTGLIRTLENHLSNLENERQASVKYVEGLRANLAQAEARVGHPFPQQAELNELQRQFDELQKALEGVEEAPASQTAEPSRPKAARPPPVVAGTVAEGLPALLENVRESIAELEAVALTDMKLTHIARANSKDNFALVARGWVSDYVVDRCLADGSYDLAPFASKDSPLGSYLVERIWALREVGERPEAHRDGSGSAFDVPASLRAQAELLGAERWAWIMNRVSRISQDSAGRDAAEPATPTGSVFDQLDPAAARETLSVERDRRVTLETAREAAELAAEYDRSGESELAAVERATVAREREQLAKHIQREWQQFKLDRHSSQWMTVNAETAADEVVAARHRVSEQVVNRVDPPTERPRQVSEVEVGIT